MRRYSISIIISTERLLFEYDKPQSYKSTTID